MGCLRSAGDSSAQDTGALAGTKANRIATNSGAWYGQVSGRLVWDM
jgi:hypothetical protein